MVRRLSLLAVLCVCLGLASIIFTGDVEAASTGRFYSLSADGTLYNSGDNYTTIQAADDGIVEYTTTILKVGQQKSGSTYTVWRPVLFFDTTKLPEGVVVSSAFVTIRGKENHSGRDFNLVLVQPGDMDSPMDSANYGTVGDKTTTLNDTFNTASYATSMQLDLNGDGVASLMHEGITIFGLRSQYDIAADDPDGDEYLDLYSSESSYPPILTVNYYAQTLLGTPSTIHLTSIAVFQDYYETGDQLYVLRSNVNYESGIDELDSVDYFSIQILEGSTVKAQVPLWSWGYVPASIYLSAANALEPGVYTIMITGTEDKFLVEVPYTSHTILNTEYRGTDMSALDTWVAATAVDIGRVEYDSLTYYLIQVSGKWRLNDAGGELFAKGIPLLDSQRPHLFANPTPSSQEIEHKDKYAGTLWANWGLEFTEDWELIGQIAGIPGMVAASMAFLIFGGYVIVRVQAETGKPMLGMMPAVGVLLLGSLLGIPLWIILSATAIAVIYFYKELVLGSSM